MVTLAIDAGRTTMQFAMVDDGAMQSSWETPGLSASPPTAAPESLAKRIREGLEAQENVPPGLVVSAGIAGVLTPGPATQALAAHLLDELRASTVVLASDVVVAYLGAVGIRPGVVLSVGTGSIALAISHDGRHKIIDGTGYLLDDAGSGFDIGRRGLIHGLRARDGRGESTTLSAAADRRFGERGDLLESIYGSSTPAALIASFARDVVDAARSGDAPAQAILDTAVDEWATAIAAGASTLPTEAEITCSWAGGVLNGNPDLARRLRERLDQTPRLHPLAPAGDGLAGAIQLVRAVETPAFASLTTRWNASDAPTR